MLSMLFLVLFSTLAVGFYSSTNMTVQTAENDRRVALAQMAAECGMDLMRYQLAHVLIPPNTPSNQVIGALAGQLSANLNGTRNMGGESVGLVNNVIYIPATQSHTLALDALGLQRFRIAITAWGSDVVVKSTGSYGGTVSGGAVVSVNRSITMDFTAKAVPTQSFDYALASKGQIVVSKGSVTATASVDPAIASLMSDSATAGAVTVTGGVVGGDLNIVQGASATIIAGNVGGATSPAIIQSQHVHVVGDPDFPQVDTSIFLPYATNAYVPNAPVQQNIIVPPGTNPKFNGGDEIDGVMYVKSPNQITFRGNATLKGFIVVENAGSTSVNTMDFRGSLSVVPLPAGSQFDSLRSVSGLSILAPTTAITMSGSADSTVRGNVIVGSFSYAGASNLYMDHGTIMTFNTTSNSMVVNTSKSILWNATGETNQPSTGLIYSSYFAPKPSTYQEIPP
jgi:hypothetical protein